jgi:general secretion pathway protein J
MISRETTRKMRSTAADELGFTLLEILIAIAILALVVSSLYGAYSGTLKTIEMVEHVRDVEQAGRLALAQIADDFRSFFRQASDDDSEGSPSSSESSVPESEEEAASVVEFTTAAHLDFDPVFPDLRINRVRYVLEKQTENEKYFRLIRHERLFTDVGGESEEKAMELVDGVESLTLTYLDEDGQMTSEWDTDGEQTGDLCPRLIKIDLKVGTAGGERSKEFTLAVAPAACQRSEKR